MRDSRRARCSYQVFGLLIFLCCLIGVALSDRVVAQESGGGQKRIADLSSPDAQVRLKAARALRSQPDPGAVDRLIVCLRDADPGVRWWAAEALGTARDARAVKPLAEVLKDEDTPVPVAAMRSLIAPRTPVRWTCSFLCSRTRA